MSSHIKPKFTLLATFSFLFAFLFSNASVKAGENNYDIVDPDDLSYTPIMVVRANDRKTEKPKTLLSNLQPLLSNKSTGTGSSINGDSESQNSQLVIPIYSGDNGDQDPCLEDNDMKTDSPLSSSSKCKSLRCDGSSTCRRSYGVLCCMLVLVVTAIFLIIEGVMGRL